MKNTNVLKIIISLLIILAVIGFGVSACSSDSNDSSGDGGGGGGSKTDPALNGIWIESDSMECTFNNGNWEDRSNGVPYAKGTYTTNNGQMTVITTQLWGSGGPFQLNLEAKWYTKAEILSLKPGYSWNDGYTKTYSVSGNTVTFTNMNGETYTWPRKQ